MASCESPSKRCNIRNTLNYNQVLREITGRLISAEGHHIAGSVRYVADMISLLLTWAVLGDCAYEGRLSSLSHRESLLMSTLRRGMTKNDGLAD
jgi:hypothetical protein